MSHSELLRRAKAALQAGNKQEAMALCSTCLLSDPDDVAALRLYANLCAREGDVSNAIKNINHVIALNDMDEPCDYFYRGRWQLRAGKLDMAITDFEQVITLCHQHGDAYYLEDSYLHQAIAFYYQENRDKAANVLQYVGDECRTCVNGVLFSKAYILG
jgi:hypothetical protein